MRNPVARAAGLTLVELLIATAIVGIIIGALLNLTTGTTRLMQVTSSTADVLRDLSDVTGYVGDNVRRSRFVFANATVNGSACSVTATLPCFALVFGDIEGTGTTVNRYRFVAYRIVPRSSLPATFRSDDPWADANTHAIIELRRTICAPSATPCTAATVLTDTVVTGAEEFLVYVGLSLTSAGHVTGTTVAPFVITGTDRVTMRFRAAHRVGGDVRHVPALAQGPHELEVVKRNE